MPGRSPLVKAKFVFGSTKVEILQGNLLDPEVRVDALVSSDDNYLTMGSGISRALAKQAGPEYVREAQGQCPVRVGTVVVTAAHGLSAIPRVKRVLHGTVIDYDTDERSPRQIVREVTFNCLAEAEQLRLRSLVFPAFATGAGQLTMEACAREMCGGIKEFLARERYLDAVYLMLYLPEAEDDTKARFRALNDRFINEANLVLGVPYDPSTKVCQSVDVLPCDLAVGQLEKVITGEAAGKRHAAILGGPWVGKTVLLNSLLRRARDVDDPLGEDRRLCRVTFGRLHTNTPAPFIYRKLLLALREFEEDPRVVEDLAEAYAEEKLTCDQFLELLDRHAGHFREVVFLIDHLPQLLRMGADDFWRDVDKLASKVRLVFTARDELEYEVLLARLSADFKAGLEEVRLTCVHETTRTAWLDSLYNKYLGRAPSESEQEFVGDEAGRHPYLINLVSHALLAALKEGTLTEPQRRRGLVSEELTSLFRKVRDAIEGSRQRLFEVLIGSLVTDEERVDLENLVEAWALERAKGWLDPSNDRDEARLRELEDRGDPRRNLHIGTLKRLEARGYLVDADSVETVGFSSRPFAEYLIEVYGVDVGGVTSDEPLDVTITLFRSEPQLLRTIFRSGAAQVVTAHSPFTAEQESEFLQAFDTFIRRELTGRGAAEASDFADLETVGEWIRRLMTGRVRKYLENPPHGSTVNLVVEGQLVQLPWELMLERARASGVGCNLGRSIMTEFQGGERRAARREGKIKALLIGDPTDDLPLAREEVEQLKRRLSRHPSFENPDALVGSEQIGSVLSLESRMQQGEYGLVHYSGHSRLQGSDSAWQLNTGAFTTHRLTAALTEAPPAIVFSSSCESAAGGEMKPPRYENQTFDLPGAFLAAGVQAYVGTLWSVGSNGAMLFAEAFYDALLNAEQTIAECLALAKEARMAEDGINASSFVLYGDPHSRLSDWFPDFSPGD